MKDGFVDREPSAHSSLGSLVLCVALAASGCAEATFSAHSRDNAVEDIRRTLKTVRPAGEHGAAMAYLVTVGGPTERKLVAFDLQKAQVAWQLQTDVRSRVVFGGGLIAHKEGAGELVVRDAASGRERFRVKFAVGDHYVGAALDDEHLYYVVQASGGTQRISTVIAVDTTGREVWRAPAEGSLGAPAAERGVVAVPFRYQNICFIDGKTGRELARVRGTDEQLTFVRATDDGFFYGGQSGIYAFDDKSASGTRAGSTFAEAKLGSDQVRTAYYWDGYQPAQVEYGAFDRNRLLWRAHGSDGGLSFRDDTVVLQSFRYFFAFNSKVSDGKLRWAYAHPRVDLVAAELTGRAVVWASIDGDIGSLDLATGAPRKPTKTGLRILGATFDADGFSGTGEGDKPDLVKMLEQIIFDPDARFGAVKVFAVDALGAQPGGPATAVLLKAVLATRGVPPAAQKRAGELLVAKKDKGSVQVFLDALAPSFDFVEDRSPRGVDVLARAVSALDAKDAVPSLARHLLDPATPSAALKDIAAALINLSGAKAGHKPDKGDKGACKEKDETCKTARRALRDLVFTYRADAAFLADPAPLTVAAEGLWRLGGENDRRALQFVAAEPRTLLPLAKYVQQLSQPPK